MRTAATIRTTLDGLDSTVDAGERTQFAKSLDSWAPLPPAAAITISRSGVASLRRSPCSRMRSPHPQRRVRQLPTDQTRPASRPSPLGRHRPAHQPPRRVQRSDLRRRRPQDHPSRQIARLPARRISATCARTSASPYVWPAVMSFSDCASDSRIFGTDDSQCSVSSSSLTFPLLLGSVGSSIAGDNGLSWHARAGLSSNA
jgi:hypothetical protein